MRTFIWFGYYWSCANLGFSALCFAKSQNRYQKWIPSQKITLVWLGWNFDLSDHFRTRTEILICEMLTHVRLFFSPRLAVLIFARNVRKSRFIYQTTCLACQITGKIRTFEFRVLVRKKLKKTWFFGTKIDPFFAIFKNLFWELWWSYRHGVCCNLLIGFRYVWEK